MACSGYEMFSTNSIRLTPGPELFVIITYKLYAHRTQWNTPPPQASIAFNKPQNAFSDLTFYPV